MHMGAGMGTRSCQKVLQNAAEDDMNICKVYQKTGILWLGFTDLSFKRLSDAGGLFLLPFGPVKGVHQRGQLLWRVLLYCLLHLHQGCLGLQRTFLPQIRAPALTEIPQTTL